MKYLLSFAIISVLLAGCKKEGCTSTSATNYQSDADKDDNSCLYNGSLIFWINANTSTGYQNSFINEFRVYIDNIYIGSMSTNSSLLDSPDCETGGGVSHFADLQSESSKVVQYKVTYTPLSAPGTTPDEVTEFEGSVKITGGKCTPFQLQ